MKLRVSLPSAAMALLSFFLFTNCNKVFDYLKNHPGEKARLCQVKKLKLSGQPIQPEVNIVYNSEGNPLHMLVSNVPQFYPASEYHFRYDNYNRLTDYFFNYYGNIGVLTWDRYSYPNKYTVIDSGWAYTGLITDAVPPHDPAKLNRLIIYSLDAAGRIIKTTQPSGDPNYPPFITNFTYDSRGNLVRPGVTYDNKVNAYQTNKVWMFIFNDYSVNNPFSQLYSPATVTITSYNEAGLPLQLNNSGSYAQVYLFNYSFTNMEIVYDCDWSQLPGKY